MAYLPQVSPLSPDEIRRVRTLTIFDVSTEFLAFIIAEERFAGTHNLTQRKIFRGQLEQLILPIRNQLQASSPTAQTAQQLFDWLISSWTEQELNALVKRGLWYDEAHIEGGNYRPHLARYHNEERFLKEWQDSERYGELWHPYHNPDPVPPA